MEKKEETFLALLKSRKSWHKTLLRKYNDSLATEIDQKPFFFASRHKTIFSFLFPWLSLSVTSRSKSKEKKNFRLNRLCHDITHKHSSTFKSTFQFRGKAISSPLPPKRNCTHLAVSFPSPDLVFFSFLFFSSTLPQLYIFFRILSFTVSLLRKKASKNYYIF